MAAKLVRISAKKWHDGIALYKLDCQIIADYPSIFVGKENNYYLSSINQRATAILCRPAVVVGARGAC